MGPYDLVICGKQTTDGDTAQVGAEMAEHLGLPYACYVDKIIEEIKVFTWIFIVGDKNI